MFGTSVPQNGKTDIGVHEFVSEVLSTGKAEAGTFYYSNYIGDDTRSSAQAQNPLTPWKNHPWDLVNATGNCATYDAQPGDRFVPRMGDIWYRVSISGKKSGSLAGGYITTAPMPGVFFNPARPDSFPVMSGGYYPGSLTWTQEGTTTSYRTTAAVQVYYMSYNGVNLTLDTTHPCSLNKFYWKSADSLFVNVGEAPDSTKIKIGNRSVPIVTSSTSAGVFGGYTKYSNLIVECANGNESGAGIDVFQDSTCVVDSCTVRNVPWIGIRTYEGYNASVTNNKIYGCRAYGIFIRATNGLTCTNNTIFNQVNNSSTKAEADIYASPDTVAGIPAQYAKRINVSYNTIRNNSTKRGIYCKNPSPDTTVVSYNLVHDVGTSNSTDVEGINVVNPANIHHNVVYNTRYAGIHVTGSSVASDIHHNTVYSVGYQDSAYYGYPGTFKKNGFTESMGIALSTTSGKWNVYSNYIYNCGEGIRSDCTSGSLGTNTIHHNVVAYNIGSGIIIDCSTKENGCYKVLNNTVVHYPYGTLTDEANGYQIQYTATSVGDTAYFGNNICYNMSSNSSKNPCLFINYVAGGLGKVYANNNHYYCPNGGAYGKILSGSTATTLAAWKAAIQANAYAAGFDGVQASAEAATTAGDPKFVNLAGLNYALRSGSPCIDVGYNLGFTADYLGKKIPYGKGPDVGAFEKQAAWKSMGEISSEIHTEINTSLGF